MTFQPSVFLTQRRRLRATSLRPPPALWKGGLSAPLLSRLPFAADLDSFLALKVPVTFFLERFIFPLEQTTSMLVSRILTFFLSVRY